MGIPMISNEMQAELKKVEIASRDINDFIIAIVAENERLKSALKKKEIKQKESKQRESLVWQPKYRKESESQYVMVLIDGDGYIFNDEYIKQGYQGGIEAAKALEAHVKTCIRQRRPEITGQYKVFAYVFASVTGVTRYLAVNVPNTASKGVGSFRAGFSNGSTFAEFVDVGYANNAAESKICDRFEYAINDRHCRHVFVAACHDKDYSSTVKSHAAKKENEPSSVTIIRTCGLSLEGSLLANKFDTVEFRKLFLDLGCHEAFNYIRVVKPGFFAYSRTGQGHVTKKTEGPCAEKLPESASMD